MSGKKPKTITIVCHVSNADYFRYDFGPSMWGDGLGGGFEVIAREKFAKTFEDGTPAYRQIYTQKERFMLA